MMERYGTRWREGSRKPPRFWDAAVDWYRARFAPPQVARVEVLACEGSLLEWTPPRRAMGNPFADCLQASAADLEGLARDETSHHY
jgi:hypothetical protein